jgi:penicillin-binding protein 2
VAKPKKPKAKAKTKTAAKPVKAVKKKKPVVADNIIVEPPVRIEGNKRIEYIPANRGRIFDRTGKYVLARNQAVFDLAIVPSELISHQNFQKPCSADAIQPGGVSLVTKTVGKKKIRRRVVKKASWRCVHLSVLFKTLARKYRARLTNTQKRRFYRLAYQAGKANRLSKPIRIRFQVSHRVSADIISNQEKQELIGVKILSRQTRVYPYGSLFAHVVGFTAPIYNSERKALLADPDKREQYMGVTRIGKRGIEKQYDEILQGKPGIREVTLDANGSAVSSKVVAEPVAGKDIYLTVNYKLTRYADRLLRKRRGAVVALDPNNGQVLALVSKPSYNPNAYTNGRNYRRVAGLKKLRRKHLVFSRATHSWVPPGSTVKPYYALAGLHYSQLPRRGVNCNGYFKIRGYKRPWRDWNYKEGGHRHTGLRKSIVHSCDVYYYTLATRLGIDKIDSFLQLFGFGEATDIDLPAEKTGVRPSREFKKTRYKKPAHKVWFPGDTVTVGIGQGYFVVTPLQQAVAVATIASRGVVYKPRVLLKIRNGKGFTQNPPVVKRKITRVRDEHWELITKHMVGVVHGGGTAKATARYTRGRFKIVGKTGTAQLFKVEADAHYEEKEVPKHLRDHAWFVAFAPYKKPKVAIAVFVEHGGHGSDTAAPIAGRFVNRFMQPYLPAKSKRRAVRRIVRKKAKPAPSVVRKKAKPVPSVVGKKAKPVIPKPRNRSTHQHQARRHPPAIQ